ncbi:MAG: HEAT repeat domain-containing protein [Acidobacteriota bacterium]
MRPFVAMLLGITMGCASADVPAPRVGARPVPVAGVDDLAERALLLMLADRKTYEPLLTSEALVGGVEVRRQAALTIARIGDPRGGPVLESLLADPAVAVRRAATFGLGELGELGYAAEQALLGMVNDEDREIGRLAVEAMAKSGSSLETVVERLIAGASDELFPRLLPALFRFEGDGVVRWAVQGLREPSPVRKMAAYALGRNPLPAGLEALRGLLTDEDPWIRGMAARGVGRVGDRSDVERLRPLLDDPQPGPIIQTLRALRRLFDDGKAAPPEAWQPRLLELMADPRPGVRLTAIEASAAWLLDEAIGQRLAELVTSGLRRERELALLALAEGEDPRAAILLVRLAGDRDPVLRSVAAQAAGFFRAAEVLERLATDDDAGVRRTVLETRLAGEPPESEELVRAALEDRDPTVRATALEWAAEHPTIEMEKVFAAMSGAWRDRIPDARINGIRALAARAETTPTERGAIIVLLEELARDDEYLVRRRAARGLVELERDPPAVGGVRTRKSVEVYREIIQRTARPRRLDLVTERGTLGIELACPEAPLTCLNFLQLAGQGYFEGLRFHRVVPDFVIQAGDPRGDGWGGPGYAIRDEMNLLRYRRGMVGMALSGPDTGGSQFFITLAPQPHLDGGYTIFGRIIAGEDVLDEVVQGDKILRIVEQPAA